MISREQICSQQTNCMSCLLSRKLTDKDCRELTENEIQNIMSLFRELEKFPDTVTIYKIFEEYLQKENEMYIGEKWYTEPEIKAYVSELEAKKAEMKQILRDCMRVLAVAEFDFPKFRDEADKIYEQIEKIMK